MNLQVVLLSYTGVKETATETIVGLSETSHPI